MRGVGQRPRALGENKRRCVGQRPTSSWRKVHGGVCAGGVRDEIIAHLKTLGAEVSRSSLGRYLENVDTIAEQM